MNTPILEQQTRNPKVLKNVASPDTDSREIELNNQETGVTPDLMFDHTRMKYTVPPAFTQDVIMFAPINTEDRTLHWLDIDNSNSTTDIKFTFNQNYVFLDDTANTTKEYTVTAGKKMSWFGTMTGGKLQFRVSSESTN